MNSIHIINLSLWIQVSKLSLTHDFKNGFVYSGVKQKPGRNVTQLRITLRSIRKLNLHFSIHGNETNCTKITFHVSYVIQLSLFRSNRICLSAVPCQYKTDLNKRMSKFFERHCSKEPTQCKKLHQICSDFVYTYGESRDATLSTAETGGVTVETGIKNSIQSL